MLLLNTVAAALSVALGILVTASAKEEAADLEMWRLECGEMLVENIYYFSDAFAYDGQTALASNGCYLIRRNDSYFLWDAGIPSEFLGEGRESDGWKTTLDVTIAEQLAEIGVSTTQVTRLGVSHFHGDHIGQAADFAHATLFINKADADWIRNNPPGNARRRLAPWFDGDGAMEAFTGDHDVFGDGSVVILATPGHTPGHGVLLVRLAETGPVLLSGDLYHFRKEIGRRNVSQWNTSRADTLASIERFEAIIEALDPLVIIQHDPKDIDKLPAFPKSAK